MKLVLSAETLNENENIGRKSKVTFEFWQFKGKNKWDFIMAGEEIKDPVGDQS